jgi:pilus assembly protein CpaB
MKPKTLILMATAIVCGLGASYMTSRLLAERGTGDADLPKVAVLVAKKHLDMATPLKNPGDLFEVKEFIAGDEPKNAVVNTDQVKGKFLKRALRKGDALTTEDVSDNFTVLPVPPGMRAVGLRVNVESIAGGFASLPGSRVDIINTVRRGTDDDSKSSYLLENVLVLAADAQSTRGEGQAMPASVVTVALSPKDALRVTLAKDLGPLTLVLRDAIDNTKADTGSISVTQVLRSPSAGKTEGAGSAAFEEGPANGGSGASEGTIPVIAGKAAKSAKPAVEVAKGTKPAAEAAKPAAQGARPEVVVRANESPAARANEPPPITSTPEVRKHVVTVVEGQHRRKVLFVLNDNGEVNQEDVTEAPPAPSAAPPAAAPRPAPPAPAGTRWRWPGTRPGQAAAR